MDVVRYRGNFVDCRRDIFWQAQFLATARDQLVNRTKEVLDIGTSSQYFLRGSWSAEGTVRIKGISYWCLHDFAPTSIQPQTATEANKEGKYLQLDDSIRICREPAHELIPRIAHEDRLKPIEERRVLIPLVQDDFKIDTQNLGDVDILKFLARDPKIAQQYGLLLHKHGVHTVNFKQIESLFDNVAAGLYISRILPESDAGFLGYDRSFADPNGSMFGVDYRAAPGTYTKQNLAAALKPQHNVPNKDYI